MARLNDVSSPYEDRRTQFKLVTPFLDVRSILQLVRAISADKKLRSAADWMIGVALAKIKESEAEHAFARHCLENFTAMTPEHFAAIYTWVVGSKAKKTKPAAGPLRELLKPFLKPDAAKRKLAGLQDPVALKKADADIFILRLRVIGVDPESHAFATEEDEGGNERRVARKFSSCAFRKRQTLEVAIGTMARACIYLIDQGKVKNKCKFSMAGTCIPDFSAQTVGYASPLKTGQLLNLLQDLYKAKELQPFVSDKCPDAEVNRRKILYHFVEEQTKQIPVTHVTAVFIDVTKNNFHLLSLYPTEGAEDLSVTHPKAG